MKYWVENRRLKKASVFGFTLGLATFLGLISGCGGGATDQRFAPESYDEYKEPLTDAIIGTPSGVILVGASDAGSSSGSVVSTSTSTGSSIGTGIGDGGGFFGDGGGPDAGSGGGFGQWHFDDCSPTSNFLIDSSGEGANAQHALKSDCVPGISGLGVEFRTAKDVVQVPDEPQFVVGPRVAVAAWVHPTTVTGDQPIVIKRLNNQTSFSLGVHNGNIEMSVVLTTGKTIISQAPIAAGTWTHVAGMYDGTFVYLFINGQQFGQVFAAGTLRDVFAPIRIGATTQTQFFDGIIDEVFVSTEAITKDALTALSCIHRPTTLVVNPVTSPAVPFDTTVHYDVLVSDNDVGACAAVSQDLFFETSAPGITVNFDAPGSFQTASPGTTTDFGVDVTGSDDADPGLHTLPFEIEAFGGSPNFNFEFLTGQLNYVLAQPTGCFVTTREELMITDTSVVDDPVRTLGVFDPQPTPFDGGVFSSDAGVFFGATPAPAAAVTVPRAAIASDAASGGETSGAWTFGQLMRGIAPTPAQAPAMTLALFQHWLTDQTVNGFTVTARPAMQQVLLDVWPKTSNGDLDLDQPPLRLQAIVNRIDLRNLASGSAGEARFVFAVNGAGFPQSFTVILEYNLPAQTQQDVANWATLWHGLASHPFPSAEYNTALQAITDRITASGAAPGQVNGSNLVELRTNEIALSFQWELRAFALSPSTGFFDETTVKETPDLSFNGTQTFADFVNQNATAIMAEIPGANDNTVPAQFEGQNFLAGSVFNNQIEWSGPGILNPDARFHASLNTCNGCHGPESGTFNFTMITPRTPGTEAILSPFLTGTTAFDDFTGQTRTLNDLARRRTDLTGLVCAPATDGGSVSSDAGSVSFDAGSVSFDAGIP